MRARNDEVDMTIAFAFRRNHRALQQPFLFHLGEALVISAPQRLSFGRDGVRMLKLRPQKRRDQLAWQIG